MRVSEQERASLSHHLRRLRTMNGITLDKLSAITGLDKGYLSRLERGQKMPSIATVMKLASALSVSIDQLFGLALPNEMVRVTRVDARVRLAAEAGAGSFEMLPKNSAMLDAFILHPSGELSAAHAEHGGEELLFVLSGRLELRFIDRSFVLEVGDCAQFPGHLAHRIRSLDGPASGLVVIAKGSKTVVARKPRKGEAP